MAKDCNWIQAGLTAFWTSDAHRNMERPLSQTENLRPSGLKPPSRLPALSTGGSARTLLETSQSDLNARSAGVGGMMPRPATVTAGHGSVKHKMAGRECGDQVSPSHLFPLEADLLVQFKSRQRSGRLSQNAPPSR
ncbi:hypothetical protein ES702_02654 [subsurface metagenome]